MGYQDVLRCFDFNVLCPFLTKELFITLVPFLLNRILQFLLGPCVTSLSTTPTISPQLQTKTIQIINVPFDRNAFLSDIPTNTKV